MARNQLIECSVAPASAQKHGGMSRLARAGIAVIASPRIASATIGHLAITRSGIWVIDTRCYEGRPTLLVEGGLISPRRDKVYVGRNDCTRHVDDVLRQVDAVGDLVGEVPVVGALCFVDSDWPLVGGSFVTRDVHVLWPKLLVRELLKSNVGEVDVAAIQGKLSAGLTGAFTTLVGA